MEILTSKLKYYFEKILTFARAELPAGGMEISDSTIRLVYFDGREWKLGGVRLTPGIISEGKIKDLDRFLQALTSVKLQVFGKKYEKRMIRVVVSLNSIHIYSQVFTLPIMKGENLGKAIQLNIQMVSPVDIAQVYSGWQKVGEDQHASRLEILSAFIDRAVVDDINKALFQAEFLVTVLESKALSLSRLLRKGDAGVDITKPYILISLDDSGLDFLIIRHGQTYFEYFNPWREIIDEKGQISTELFHTTVTRSLYQVLNFYSQHWQEPVAEVIISATALRDELSKIVKDNFPLGVKNLDLKLKNYQAIEPEWFVPISCSIRGSEPRREDREMSLLGIGAEEEFFKERLVGFAAFWRFVMPFILGIMVVVFVVLDLFLIKTKNSLESQSSFNLNSVQAEENKALQARAEDFNRSVAFIRAAESGGPLTSKIIEKISHVLSTHGVLIGRLSFQNSDAPVTLNGSVKSEEALAAFKNALQSNPFFKEVNLPLSGVSAGPSGVNFSMTFKINQEND